MEGISRQLLASNAEGDPTAPFFGFIGAASALVFSCASLARAATPSPRLVAIARALALQIGLVSWRYGRVALVGEP